MPFPPFSQGPSTVLPVGRKKRTGQEDIDLSLSPSGLKLCFLWELASSTLPLLCWFLFALSSSQLAMKQHLPSPDLSCHHTAIFIYNCDMLFTFWIAWLGEMIIVCLSWISLITSMAFDFWTLLHKNPVFPTLNSQGLFFSLKKLCYQLLMAIKPLVERGAIHRIRLYLSLQKTLHNLWSTPGNKSTIEDQVPASSLLWEKRGFFTLLQNHSVCSEHSVTAPVTQPISAPVMKSGVNNFC